MDEKRQEGIYNDLNGSVTLANKRAQFPGNECPIRVISDRSSVETTSVRSDHRSLITNPLIPSSGNQRWI
jgi:hypothetical protein